MKTTLEAQYTSSKQVIKMLNARYGLNPLGVKKLLQINGTRYNALSKGDGVLNHNEITILTTVFSELEGRLCLL